MATKRKCKIRKPKGYFLGGIAKGLFGSEQKQKITQPGYVEKLGPDFVKLFQDEFARPDASTVAPLSADAQGAFGQIRDLAYNDPTGYGDALAFSKSAITSGFDPNEPWNERLVQTTLADYDRSTEMDRARAARDQAGRGAFGDRAYIDQRERDRTATNDRALLEARLMEEGINRRQQAGQALAGLAGAERGQAFTGAQALDLAGQRQEQREQQVLDTPFRRMQAITPVFGSAPSATNTQQGGNVASGIAGLGLAGAGLYSSGALGALAGLFKDGGKVKKYQDGGPMLSPRDEQRRIQAALARALREGNQEEARNLRRLLNARIEADRRGPMPTEDPRMEAAEERRAGPSMDPLDRLQRHRDAMTAQDRPEDLRNPFEQAIRAAPWLTDNPVTRGVGEGWAVLTGRAPLRPTSDTAAPSELPEQLSAPEPGAFVAPRPAARPARATPSVPATQAAPAQPRQPPQTMRPQPRPADGMRPRELVGALNGQQPTPNQAVAIGSQVARTMAEQVPEEEKGAFAKWIENPLTLMGLGMMASRNPTFFGAFGEGALGALDIIDKRQAQEFQQDRQTSEDQREAEEAERRRRRDAISDEQWQATFGYTQQKDREAFDLAQRRLDQDAELNAARIENFRRPPASSGRSRGPQDVYLEQLYRKRADLMADPFADPAILENVLREIAAQEAAMSGIMPALPPGFEMAEP